MKHMMSDKDMGKTDRGDKGRNDMKKDMGSKGGKNTPMAIPKTSFIHKRLKNK